MGPSGYPPSIWDGVPLATLQANVLKLQAALIELTAGGRVVKATYSQGDGARTVEFTPANRAELTMLITNLQTIIGQQTGVPVNRRRPLSPYFGR